MLIDLTGQTFGKLTVIKRSEKRDKEREAYWDCICECGKETRIRGTLLRNGKRKDCGCEARKQASERKTIDLLNQRFGRLVVIEKGQSVNGRLHWVCKCDCGNVVEVISQGLRYGTTKSCGCLQKEKTSQASVIDIKGLRFGKLVVLEQAASRSQKAYWKCQCDCGNIKEIAGSDLRNGSVKSCGCLKQSLPESEIEQTLDKLQIEYEREKVFLDLQGLGGGHLRFDFFLPQYNTVIEYQGEQHYNQNFKYDSTKEGFLRRQAHDEMKKQYCKQHKIKLLEIPYWEKENIFFILQNFKEEQQNDNRH